VNIFQRSAHSVVAMEGTRSDADICPRNAKPWTTFGNVVQDLRRPVAIAAVVIVVSIPLALGWTPWAPPAMPAVTYEPLPLHPGVDSSLASGNFDVHGDHYAWDVVGRYSERYEYYVRVFHVDGQRTTVWPVEARLDFGPDGIGTYVDGRPQCAACVPRVEQGHLKIPVMFQASRSLDAGGRLEGLALLHLRTYDRAPLGAFRSSDVAEAFAFVVMPAR
jgi:hypothetical protein